MAEATRLVSLPGTQEESERFFYKGYIYHKDKRERVRQTNIDSYRCAHRGVPGGCKTLIKATSRDQFVMNRNNIVPHTCGFEADDHLLKRLALKRKLIRLSLSSFENLSKIFYEEIVKPE